MCTVTLASLTRTSPPPQLRPRWLILQDLGLTWSLTKAFARPHSAFEAEIRNLIADKGAPKKRVRRPGSSPEEKREYLEGLGMEPGHAARVAEEMNHMTLSCIQRKVGKGLSDTCTLFSGSSA